MSRSTWACELKFFRPWDLRLDDVTLHVSVWVEICAYFQSEISAWSRSTWACELKFFCNYLAVPIVCHAPRERVSWNHQTIEPYNEPIVTLHVSVWVEMTNCPNRSRNSPSRSTWACELKLFLTFPISVLDCHAPRERVSWNLPCSRQTPHQCRHAPRERVSWNLMCRADSFNAKRHAPRERVSWNIFVEERKIPYECHAPRERVSWNLLGRLYTPSQVASRSTWACELK